MPASCVIGGCSLVPRHSSVWEDCVFLHRVPDKKRDRKRHLKWVSYIKTTLRDFPGATSHTCVCSKHFHEDDYENKMQYCMMTSRGLKMQIRLKDTAVPSVPWVHPNRLPLSSPSPAVQRRKQRIQDSQRQECIQLAMQEYNSDNTPQVIKEENYAAYESDVDEMELDDLESDSNCLPVRLPKDNDEGSADVPTYSWYGESNFAEQFDPDSKDGQEHKFVVSAGNLLEGAIRACPQRNSFTAPAVTIESSWIEPASTDINHSMPNLYLRKNISIRVLAHLYPAEFMLAKSGDGREANQLSEFLNKVKAKLAGYFIDLNLVYDENNVIRGTNLFWLKVFSQPSSVELQNYKAGFMRIIQQCVELDIFSEYLGEPCESSYTESPKEEEITISLSVLDDCANRRMRTADTDKILEDVTIQVKDEPVEMIPELDSSGVSVPQDTEVYIAPETTGLESEQLSQTVAPEKLNDLNNRDVSQFYCFSCSTLHNNTDFPLYLCLVNGNHCSRKYISCSQLSIKKHQSKCHQNFKVECIKIPSSSGTGMNLSRLTKVSTAQQTKASQIATGSPDFARVEDYRKNASRDPSSEAVKESDVNKDGCQAPSPIHRAPTINNKSRQDDNSKMSMTNETNSYTHRRKILERNHKMVDGCTGEYPCHGPNARASKATEKLYNLDVITSEKHLDPDLTNVGQQRAKANNTPTALKLVDTRIPKIGEVSYSAAKANTKASVESDGVMKETVEGDVHTTLSQAKSQEYSVVFRDEMTAAFFSIRNVSTPFQCYFCSYVTNSADSINEHTLVEHKNVKCYSCRLCQFKASRKAGWIAHMSYSHSVCTHVIDDLHKDKPTCYQMMALGTQVYDSCNRCMFKYMENEKKAKRKRTIEEKVQQRNIKQMKHDTEKQSGVQEGWL